MSEEEAGKEQTDSSGKSIKLILIILIVLVLIGIGGGAAAFFMMQKNASASGEHAVPEEHIPVKPIFYSLSPFVLSLTGDRRARYMQIELSIKILDEKYREFLADYSPMIRHRLIEVLSGLPYTDVIQPEAPDKIGEHALNSLNKLFEEQGIKDTGIDDILITNLVIQ